MQICPLIAQDLKEKILRQKITDPKKIAALNKEAEEKTKKQRQHQSDQMNRTQAARDRAAQNAEKHSSAVYKEKLVERKKRREERRKLWEAKENAVLEHKKVLKELKKASNLTLKGT